MSASETTDKSIFGKNCTVRVNGNPTFHFSRWEFSSNHETTVDDDDQGFEPNTTVTGFRPTVALEYNGQQEQFRDAFYRPGTFIPKTHGEIELILVSPRTNWSCQRVTPTNDTTEALMDDTLNQSFDLNVDRPRRLTGSGSLTVQPQPDGT